MIRAVVAYRVLSFFPPKQQLVTTGTGQVIELIFLPLGE